MKARGNTTNGVNLGFEGKLWRAADKLRNNMDAAEYKHVVFGVLLSYLMAYYRNRKQSS